MRKQKQWLALLVSAAFLGGCSGGSNDATPLTSLVGGGVSGLAGSGLILSLNGGADLAVGANGTFIFPTGLASGTGYTVSVKAQPVVPHQTCLVTNATGTMGDSAVADISVACTTNNYAVRGTVAGLTGSGLALRLSSSVSLQVGADGDFAFPGQLASGSNYNVTVSRQPQTPFQTCVVANPTGVIGGSDTNITVTCTTDMFSVSGTVTGLTGLGLVLQLNGQQDLPVSTDGTFVFPNRLPRGTQYTVTVAFQTSTYREVCGLANATGTGGTANVTNVKVTCGVVSGFVYRAHSTGEISKLGVHPTTRALLPLGVAAAKAGDFVQRFIVAPNGAALYAVDMLNGGIRAFSVEPSKGGLTAIGAPVSTSPPSSASDAVVHPSGKFIYVFNIGPGTVSLVSVEAATGVLRFERDVATSLAANGYAAIDHLAISPSGSHLYVLNYAYGDPTPPTVTTYAIDSVTGSLAQVATVDAQNATGLTIDPLGRFLYLRRKMVDASVAWADVAVYPYSIDPATGAVTPTNVNTTVLHNSGDRMVVHPSGRYAYILAHWLDASDKRIDVFSIDPLSGALTANGTLLVPQTGSTEMIMDSRGEFVFLMNRKLPGTYDTSQVWCDGSTVAISGAGPSEGQLLGPGNGCAIWAENTRMIALVE